MSDPPTQIQHHLTANFGPHAAAGDMARVSPDSVHIASPVVAVGQIVDLTASIKSGSSMVCGDHTFGSVLVIVEGASSAMVRSGVDAILSARVNIDEIPVVVWRFSDGQGGIWNDIDAGTVEHPASNSTRSVLELTGIDTSVGELLYRAVLTNALGETSTSTVATTVMEVEKAPDLRGDNMATQTVPPVDEAEPRPTLTTGGSAPAIDEPLAAGHSVPAAPGSDLARAGASPGPWSIVAGLLVSLGAATVVAVRWRGLIG